MSSDAVCERQEASFREKLGSRQFVITGELTPPVGTDVSKTLGNGEIIRDFVDAVNVTDSQCAVMHMSSVAFSHLLITKNYNVIMQMTCRDRNRIAIQGDLLGAAALGIQNVLIMTGDHPSVGNNPGAKPVYDLDPVQVLETITKMKNGCDIRGAPISGSFDMCAGCVSNIDPDNMHMMKLHKKVRAGAEFIQTQAIYDIDKYDEFLELLSDEGIDVPVIGGLVPLRTLKMAEYMDRSIPGITIPEDIFDRMRNAEDQEEEGLRIAVETVRELKKMCSGVHIMPIGCHANTKRILEGAGLLRDSRKTDTVMQEQSL